MLSIELLYCNLITVISWSYSKYINMEVYYYAGKVSVKKDKVINLKANYELNHTIKLFSYNFP